MLNLNSINYLHNAILKNLVSSSVAFFKRKLKYDFFKIDTFLWNINMLIKVAIINDTRTEDGHFGCSTVMSNLEILLKKHGIEILWTWPVGIDWREHKDKLLSLGKVDALIVNGEGTIHHSSERRKMPDALSEIAGFAKKEMGIPAYLINSTLYMNTDHLYRELLNYDQIYVRDTLSQKECLAHGLEVKYAPDLSMVLPVNERGVLRRRGVGVTDSVFKDKTIQLNKIAARYDWDFVPMIKKEKPKSFLNKFGTILNINKLNLSYLSNKEFIKWLCSKELVITGRYHTVTLCILTRTPFVAIESNTPKITALLKDVFDDNSRVIYDVPLVCPDGEIVKRFANFENNEIMMIEEYCHKVEKLNIDMVKSIVKDIKSKSAII